MKGAIFDVDGTLLDSMDMWNHAGELYLAGKNIAAPPELGKIMFPMTMVQAAKYMKAAYHLPDTVEEIIEGVDRTIDRFYRYEVKPKAGILHFLQQMEKEGYVMVIATSSDRPLIEAAMERLGMARYFKRIFTCSEIGRGKSEPDIYEAARTFMGTEITKTWVFEDAIHAARTAKKAGFRLAGVYDSSSEAEQEELKNISDWYSKDFYDFNSFRAAAGAVSENG